MASEKELPSPEIVEAARKAFGMPKAGGVGVLRRAAQILGINISDFPGGSSRLVLTAIAAKNSAVHS